MIRNTVFFLLVALILSMAYAKDHHVRKLVKPPSGGDDGDYSSSGGGTTSDSVAAETTSVAEADASSSLEGSSTVGVLPSSPHSSAVTVTYFYTGRLAMVGAISGLAVMASVCLLLALAKKRRRTSPQIELDEEILVDRNTAKTSTLYKLEPLQDHLPMPVPTEIVGHMSPPVPSAKPPLPMRSRGLKGLMMGRRRPTAVMLDERSASCSSMGSSIP